MTSNRGTQLQFECKIEKKCNFWVGRARAPCFQIGMALLFLSPNPGRGIEKEEVEGVGKE